MFTRKANKTSIATKIKQDKGLVQRIQMAERKTIENICGDVCKPTAYK